jgi:hypothetical protein
MKVVDRRVRSAERDAGQLGDRAGEAERHRGRR